MPTALLTCLARRAKMTRHALKAVHADGLFTGREETVGMLLGERARRSSAQAVDRNANSTCTDRLLCGCIGYRSYRPQPVILSAAF
jgi:hypothetical protein